MIVASLRLGGLIAGADKAQLIALEEFGKNIGLAFQIADDLLDAAGTEKETGKRVGKDHSLGKITYPALCGIEQSRQLASQLIDAAVSSLALFNNAAVKLEALARYVVERNH